MDDESAHATESGREARYIGQHTTHIVGWPREEGARFLGELNAVYRCAGYRCVYFASGTGMRMRQA